MQNATNFTIHICGHNIGSNETNTETNGLLNKPWKNTQKDEICKKINSGLIPKPYATAKKRGFWVH